MKRRTLISGVLSGCLTTFLPALACAAGYAEARLLRFTGDGVKQAVVGVEIKLATGWKTYWRMPGVAGVPPRFDWSGSDNVKTVKVLYPLPQRFDDKGDETIGYVDAVVFPVLIEVVDEAKPLNLKLALDYGVCQDICIPAHAALTLDLAAAIDDRAPHWLSVIPAKLNDAVKSASVEVAANGLVLNVSLLNDAKDIFVESKTLAYFGKPVKGANVGQYSLPIFNIKDPAKLKGQEIILTLALPDRAVEQSVVLP